MSATIIIPAKYEQQIAATRSAIEKMGDTLQQDEYETACNAALATLYETLESLGADNRTLLYTAADLIPVVEENTPSVSTLDL